jgi:tetratricopeptide (TPR) repeat protein
MMKWLGGLAVILGLAMPVLPAAAQDALRQQNGALCEGQTSGAKAVAADQKIAGCTWLIQSGLLTPRQTALAYVLRAQGYSAARDTARQMADLDQAVRTDPTSSYAWAEGCSAHHWTGHEMDRAMKECTTALTLDPSSSAAWTFRGDIYLDQKRYDLAIADYDHAIALAPKWMWPWDNRGEAYLRAGHLDRAVQDFDQVIALSPDYAMGHLDRGIARIKLHQLDQAAVDFEEGVKIDPHCASCIYGRGVVKRMKGELAGGASDIAVAKAMNEKASRNFDEDGVSAP